MIFEKADNAIEKLDLKEAIKETLLYEDHYKGLLERVEAYTKIHRITYIASWYSELIESIRDNSLTHDRKFFESLDLDLMYKKIFYGELLIYRYDQGISIMDDLNFELTNKFIENCKNRINEMISKDQN